MDFSDVRLLATISEASAEEDSPRDISPLVSVFSRPPIVPFATRPAFTLSDAPVAVASPVFSSASSPSPSLQHGQGSPSLSARSSPSILFAGNRSDEVTDIGSVLGYSDTKSI